MFLRGCMDADDDFHVITFSLEVVLPVSHSI